MPEQTSSIISKVWGMCNPLRDDGLSYGDYLEQLTYLIFLKMSDEYAKPPYKKESGIPAGYTWQDMNTLTGAALEEQYKKTLEKLGEQGGILGQIFKGAINKISNAAILYRIVQMIDREKWVSMSSDVKGEIYEGLLQKNAEDVKSGAGQYFTPRALIQAMVACIRPEPMKTIADPCCGSGGFFLAAQAFLADPENYSLDREQKEFLKNGTFYGNELVASTFKLCLMNLYLHNIGDIYGSVPVAHGDSLLADPGYRVDYVLTNPPFGKKSSLTFTNEEGEQEEEDLVYNRQDFWTTSSNKQLNFVQHINTILKATGKAAVVVPDNVLFEGGAGEIVRKKLLATCDLHTILRLPTGIFYKPGVQPVLLQHIRHGNGVHNRGQHSHGIAVRTLHFAAAVLHAPPEIAAADDQADLDTQIMALANHFTHGVNLGKIQAYRHILGNALTQGFAAELQQNPPIFCIRHCIYAPSSYVLSILI